MNEVPTNSGQLAPRAGSSRCSLSCQNSTSIRDQGPTPIPGCMRDLNKLSTIHTKGHELEIIVVHKLLSQVHRTAAEPGSNYSSVIGF